MVRHALHAVASALLLFATLAACAVAPDTDSTPATALAALPEGTRWHLHDSSLDALKLPEAREVTLHIEAGRLHGNSGCNQYSAGYRFEAGRFVLEPVAATKRGCLGPGGAIEQAYFAALRQLQGFGRRGEALVMQLADGGHLEFHPSPLATE
jgi:heat shock protein HslJ